MERVGNCDEVAALAAAAVAGPPGRQSSAAMKHRQPTPSSIATAEARVQEGERVKRATAALAQARESDRSDDNGTCGRLLTPEVQSVNRRPRMLASLV
jgi:hypothetical protein